MPYGKDQEVDLFSIIYNNIHTNMHISHVRTSESSRQITSP